MLRYTILTLSILFTLATYAQEVQVLPQNHFIEEFAPQDYGHITVVVKNNSSSSMQIEFETLENSFPGTWEIGLCAGPKCYIGIPSVGDLGIVEAGQAVLLNFNVIFNGNEGEGQVRMRIYNKNNPDVSENLTVQYMVQDQVTSVEDQDFAPQISIGPNPTHHRLFLKMSESEPKDVQIFNLSGQSVWSQEKISGNMEVDLSTFPPAPYVVLISQNGRIVHSEKILKQ